MHASLVPDHPGLNRWIGRVCLLMYAGLSYKRCCRNHRRHHQAPETVEDPDYQRCTNNNILDWYVHFMGNYLGWQQLLNLSCVWLALTFRVSELLCAVLPSVVVQCSATYCQFLSIVPGGNLVTPSTWSHDTTGRYNTQPEFTSSTLFRSLLPLWLPSRASRIAFHTLVSAAKTSRRIIDLIFSDQG